MNTLAVETEAQATGVRCTDDELVVTLADGRVLSVPLLWFPRLAQATAEQRQHNELIGNGEGIHWPAVDEDISVRSLLLGRPSIEFSAPLRRPSR